MEVGEKNTIAFLQETLNRELLNFSDNKLPSSPEKLYTSVKYALTLGGKRTRPLCVLLACDLFGGETKKALPAALAIELFHNFTLVHDDIMDAAPLRRNASTVHKKWNTNVAILCGDAILVKAYQLLNELNTKNKNEILDVFSSVALQVCEGQQFDMDYEQTKTISIADYLHMIELKTAVLLAASFKIGALIAETNTTNIKQISEFGKHIGIAFQIKDDILDAYSETEKFGKQKGGDIISNKKTYLLLKAIEKSVTNKKAHAELNHWLEATDFDTHEKIKAVLSIYEMFDIKKLAEQELQLHYNKAIENISAITAVDEKKKQLIAFAHNLMNREV